MQDADFALAAEVAAAGDTVGDAADSAAAPDSSADGAAGAAATTENDDLFTVQKRPKLKSTTPRKPKPNK